MHDTACLRNYDLKDRCKGLCWTIDSLTVPSMEASVQESLTGNFVLGKCKYIIIWI